MILTKERIINHMNRNIITINHLIITINNYCHNSPHGRFLDKLGNLRV